MNSVKIYGGLQKKDLTKKIITDNHRKNPLILHIAITK